METLSSAQCSQQKPCGKRQQAKKRARLLVHEDYFGRVQLGWRPASCSGIQNCHWVLLFPVAFLINRFVARAAKNPASERIRIGLLA
jgi:hypothetical protein